MRLRTLLAGTALAAVSSVASAAGPLLGIPVVVPSNPLSLPGLPALPIAAPTLPAIASIPGFGSLLSGAAVSQLMSGGLPSLPALPGLSGNHLLPPLPALPSLALPGLVPLPAMQLPVGDLLASVNGVPTLIQGMEALAPLATAIPIPVVSPLFANF